VYFTADYSLSLVFLFYNLVSSMYDFPTMFLFLQLHPCFDSDYNLTSILKVKIRGYKHSAKYLKNKKASKCTFPPLRLIPHFIPEKSHVLLYGLPSVSLSVILVCFFPSFLLLQDMSYFKGLFFYVLHTQDHVSQQLVLRPKSKRSCALF